MEGAATDAPRPAPGKRGARGAAMALALMTVFAACAGCARHGTKYPEARSVGATVSIDASGIAVGSGRFYSYRSANGTSVDFFVYRQSSGEPRAVLDACRTCYRWKKGYVLIGQDVLCVKCGMRFRIDDLANGSGSCIPIAIASERRGETLVIPVAELEAGARYF